MSGGIVIVLIGLSVTGIAATTQKANTTLTSQVENDTVYTFNGARVLLPKNKPDLFVAWWCPHCHAALQQLKAEHDLDRFNLISVYASGDTSTPITSWRQVKALTSESLHQLNVSIPTDHIFLAMPSSPLNMQIQRVPTLWKFRSTSVDTLVGTPANANVWSKWLG